MTNSNPTAWLQAPVFPDDDEKTRVARLLNAILLVVIGLVMLFSVPALVMTPELGRILIEFSLAAFAILLYVLMRRGFVYQAAFILSTVLWAVITYGTYDSGGFRGSILSAYFGIILIAGMLLGPRGASIFGLLSIVAAGLFWFADQAGYIHPPAAFVSIEVFFWEFTSVVIGVVIFLALTFTSLRRALDRARDNEKALAIKAEEAERLAKEAQSANQFKSTLIARVSHELRTPLGAILGLTELLHYQSYGPLPPEQTEITGRVLTNVRYLELLISELLEQAQIEAGRLILRQHEFSPADDLMPRIELLRARAEIKEIQLYTSVANLPPVLRGDSERLGMILSNLVSNATKFTPRQGRIDVKIYGEKESFIMQVSDTGPGIPLQAQEKVFEPFQQLEDGTVQIQGGVGLGLSIVKQLVDAMQGEIKLISEPGHGSTFQIILPLRPMLIDASSSSPKETIYADQSGSGN